MRIIFPYSLLRISKRTTGSGRDGTVVKGWGLHFPRALGLGEP